MSYWKWIWNIIKVGIPDIQRPQTWFPPFLEYMLGVALIPVTIGVAVLIHPYYCLLFVLDLFLITHGWYRGHVAE